MFWGNTKIDWGVVHRFCDKLKDYWHFRMKFNIRTSNIKYLFQRFVEANEKSYHANRFNFLYELHRARELQPTDPRDHIFAFLGHYSLRSKYHPNRELAVFEADYNKSLPQVYIDFAKRALRGGQGDSALIALAVVQHGSLPSHRATENNTGPERSLSIQSKLPSWVADWTIYKGFILAEPISPHKAHGTSRPKMEIDDDKLILRIHGVQVDTLEDCSRVLRDREFHDTREHRGTESSVEYLWRKICQKKDFNLEDKYPNGHTAFFAFSQTLSNGCVQISGERVPSIMILTDSDGAIAPGLLELGEKADRKGGKEEWSRSVNAASKGRRFARTKKGLYVLGPAAMERGDVVCVLFGGKVPFCLRRMGSRHMLVGECYAHGLMKGEAMTMMAKDELVEKVFELV
ncbi:hypothetical protein EPUS_04814 [Endocarpon pusillum Z07020]|uniref:Heterokaryon incompatibility domain-containing protein n=1 Tax=Endocarpon pusillum (strain Z07020 / HMAS-L-300199) TaxID=1263415 RepID=U1GLJ6_ENDPU|nr:uncharacterized protein EPUS_04814 [Endocarpon pusillum Z07020]ERF72761.1 hypothetical protein EPUS_04814 [Endocarpon pusillum Z07020]